MTAPFYLDALGPAGAYRARNRSQIADVTGASAAELSVLPRVFVYRALAALRAAGELAADERAALIARGTEAFARDGVGGLPVQEYQHLTSRVSGLPIATVRAATDAIAQAGADAYRTAQQARPQGAVADPADPLTRRGCAVWTRRGNVFAVHAAGNHPGIHAAWLEALALGYRVAVRPSRRDPFTPHRLVMALRDAGFGNDHVMLLPTDHAVAGDLTSGADLSLVYGGDDVTGKYRGSGTVLPQGPGRSKVLLAGKYRQADLDLVAHSVSHGGGTACVNATAVLVEGDPVPVAEAIAERLAVLPSLPPEDEKAVLPVLPMASARAIERYVLRQAEGTRAYLGGSGIVDSLDDGSAVLRPAVFEVRSPDAPQTRAELPFPCVWVAPWSAADGISPLAGTLALAAVNCDAHLVTALLNEPTIRNVYLDAYPTHWFEPGLPHDGYLGEFLMRTKTVARGPRSLAGHARGDEVGEGGLG
jgi:acyl-CoA reductase-like NAD-dependent aldehyde dehydrogenase